MGASEGQLEGLPFYLCLLKIMLCAWSDNGVLYFQFNSAVKRDGKWTKFTYQEYFDLTRLAAKGFIAVSLVAVLLTIKLK